MEKARTRFAPSPTGYMHIGNLRTALYEYLVAKKDGGTFILRIEDTDQGRIVEGAVDIIYNTMKTCGLHHDEGPDIGGEYGPYVQSERMQCGMYKEYAEKLVELGGAHYCFCDEAVLAKEREEEEKRKEEERIAREKEEEAKRKEAERIAKKKEAEAKKKEAEKLAKKKAEEAKKKEAEKMAKEKEETKKKENEEVVVVKRGRGRPRKNPIPETTVEDVFRD